MRVRLVTSLVTALLLALPTAASASGGGEFSKAQLILDHPAPAFVPGGSPNPFFLSGGVGDWELVATIPTGNPHTDLDFFRVDGDIYASVGTLAIGPNAGGQTIIRLTQDGVVAPSFLGAHPSAACVTDPGSATGLQHDVEATPKGDVLLNTDWRGLASTARPQLLIDATDAEGRCHDQGPGLADLGAPRGGLELIDITDLANPVELHLTSHIGEAHTTNVDPKRPHIVYAVTSDGVQVSPDTKDLDGDGDTTELIRENADPDDSDRYDLDGFEIIDVSSCMGFPEGTDLQTKRDACRPQVYRYRFPGLNALSTYPQRQTNGGLKWNQSGCHELEVYPDDLLTCAAPEGTVLLDMSAAFDDNGTPDDYTDDKVNGSPLPCAVRPSSTSNAIFSSGAMVTDCVNGVDGADSLTISSWLAAGAPAIEGVEIVGTAFHGGRTASNSAADQHSPAEDVAISHEAELTHSGKFMIVSDERGGGIIAPDASCPTVGVNSPVGNGGLHAYAVDQLLTEYPGDPLTEAPADIAARAHAAYARTPEGDKAIIRITPRVKAESFCTAHVFHQIPGQNRIFMAWYQQGTSVIDYVEHEDGTFTFEEIAWFLPANSIQWVSEVFQFEENADGTFTYWGATGDFNLGEAGRNAIDVYKVTLPPPAQMAADVAPPPAPEPDPQPAPEPLPATGGGAALASLATMAAATGLLRRRRLR